MVFCRLDLRPTPRSRPFFFFFFFCWSVVLFARQPNPIFVGGMVPPPLAERELR